MLARMGVFAASAVTWIHTPELFPTRVRATGHAVCNSSAQLGSFCAPFLLNAGSSGLVGCLLAGLSGMAMLCVLPLPETSGVCLDLDSDDIDSLAHNKRESESKGFSGNGSSTQSSPLHPYLVDSSSS